MPVATALSASLLLLQAAVIEAGSFIFVETKDAMTDAVIAGATVKNEGSTLAITCDLAESKRVRVILSLDRLPLQETALWRPWLDMRFDAKPRMTAFWTVNGRRIFITGSKDVAKFTREVLTSRKVIFQAQGYASQTVDAKFDLEGGVEAVRRVSERCADAKFTQAVSDLIR